MQTTAITIAAVAIACGDHDQGILFRGDCEQLKHLVTDLSAGSCIITDAPVVIPQLGNCPAVWFVSCPVSGCPNGWTIACDEPSPGMYTNCGYTIVNNGTDQCTTIDADSVSYPAVAYLNGRRGLPIMTSTSPGECAFMKCD